MAEPFMNIANKGMSNLTRILISAVVVVVAAIGLAAFKFISYRGTGGMPTGDTSFAQVAISSPPKGAQLEAGDSMMVEAAAIGSMPFQSMELWINGELLGVQAAPSGGEHPFSTSFSWQPLEPGIYSLITAATDNDGEKVVSTQVVVFVIQNEAGIELISSGSPAVLPAPEAGGYLPPAGPGSGDSTGPASNWSGSTGDWVTSLTTGENPTAPELVVREGECAANLLIHDLSDNEEGFVVYRQTSISPHWEQVATLSSQSDVDWITLTDEGIYGAVTYYVSAYNSQGESESNIFLVNIDPENCSSDIEKRTIGTISVALQIPNLMAEKIYCYQSIDGMNWTRWPQLGFLTPDQEGSRIAGPVMQFMQNDLAGEAASPQLGLFMECWGWQEGGLQYLGSLGPEGLDPLATGMQLILGEGISAEITSDIFRLPWLEGLYPIRAEIRKIGELQLDSDQLKMFTALHSTSLEVPRVYLSLTTDPELCGDHLPPDAQNFLGQLLYCFPYPYYDPTKGSTIPQPYLVWDFDFFEPNCLGGVSEQCKNYWELLDLAEETGGQVGFDIKSVSEGKINDWKVTEPDLTMFVAPPLTCIGDSKFSVRLWYKPGKEGEAEYKSELLKIGKHEEMVFYGPYSNEVSIPCDSSVKLDISSFEPIKIPRQYLEITFEELEFTGIDDGDTSGVESYFNGYYKEDYEMYGYFRVTAPSMGHWEYWPCFFPEFGNCNYEPFWTGTRSYLNVGDWEGGDQYLEVGGYGSWLPTGETSLASDELCISSSKHSCKYNGLPTSYQKGNNSLRVFVSKGDALLVEVMLMDYDEISGDDLVCNGSELITVEIFSDWEKYSGNGQFEIQGDSSNGVCFVRYTVESVSGP